MLKYSQAISNALKAKQDCFKQIKDFSFHSAHGHFQKVSAFMSSLETRGGVQTPDMVWGSLQRGSVTSNLVFFGDEAAVLKKISEVVPKIVKKTPTPATVIAKMIALRLCRLHESIEEENAWVANSARATVPIPQRSDLEDGLQRYKQLSWRIKERAEKLDLVLRRKEITSKAIQKGWDLYSVKVVMTA
jgi:hypothetical protein